MEEVYHYENVIQDFPSLAGKTVVITGTSSGIGFEAAKYCIIRNADILFVLNKASADLAGSLKVLEELNAEEKTKLVPISCDLTSFNSVHEAAEEIKGFLSDINKPLDVLANNAGVAFLPPQITEDGFDITTQINFLSQVLLTNLLFPKLLESDEPRIVAQSSISRTWTKFNKNYLLNYKNASKEEMKEKLGDDSSIHLTLRYANSKICTAIFLMELGKRFPRIRVAVSDPGMANTKIAESAAENKTPNSLSDFTLKFSANKITQKMCQSGPDGSLGLIKAAFDENVNSGDFFVPRLVSKGEPTLWSNYGKVVEGNATFFWRWMDKSISDKEAWKECFETAEEVLGIKFE
eukprot:augustus_masked-scaffold_43-processed-gene-0.40-mRNA-1 protein AED:1.00 eAED:1.00 QI:0/-1/0/0/-1/1/1/0/349